MNDVIAIIPSRLDSSRIPKKPLVDINGMPMIAHVYHRAKLSSVLDQVWVATDSELVKQTVEAHGGQAIMTGGQHQNGTERLAEAAKILNAENVVLVNGDEALLNPEHIAVSYQALNESDAEVSILVNRFYKKNSPGDFKVVLNRKNEVMYISRGDIPCDARNPVDFRLKAYHIMTFRKGFLETYASFEKSPIELIEDHEHLRVIENGYRIIAAEVDSSAISVDTIEDLEYVREKMPDDPFYQKYRG